MENISNFPATLDIDYPDRELNRLTTFFRPFVAVPILIILCLVSGSTFGRTSNWFFVGAGGLLFAPMLLILLFRQKYLR
jgi:hypothetical protein